MLNRPKKQRAVKHPVAILHKRGVAKKAKKSTATDLSNHDSDDITPKTTPAKVSKRSTKSPVTDDSLTTSLTDNDTTITPDASSTTRSPTRQKNKRIAPIDTNNTTTTILLDTITPAEQQKQKRNLSLKKNVKAALDALVTAQLHPPTHIPHDNHLQSKVDGIINDIGGTISQSITKSSPKSLNSPKKTSETPSTAIVDLPTPENSTIPDTTQDLAVARANKMKLQRFLMDQLDLVNRMDDTTALNLTDILSSPQTSSNDTTRPDVEVETLLRLSRAQEQALLQQEAFTKKKTDGKTMVDLDEAFDNLAKHLSLTNPVPQHGATDEEVDRLVYGEGGNPHAPSKKKKSRRVKPVVEGTPQLPHKPSELDSIAAFEPLADFSSYSTGDISSDSSDHHRRYRKTSHKNGQSGSSEGVHSDASFETTSDGSFESFPWDGYETSEFTLSEDDGKSGVNSVENTLNGKIKDKKYQDHTLKCPTDQIENINTHAEKNPASKNNPSDVVSATNAPDGSDSNHSGSSRGKSSQSPGQSPPSNSSSSSNDPSSSDPSSNKNSGTDRKSGPMFDKAAYMSFYTPHASSAPKLSSSLILPLSLSIRPVFPGLYYPVVVRDPALVTEILKQVHSGFPYVSVFLKKGKNKDDIFQHHSSIHSTDKKHSPLPLDTTKKDGKQANSMENVIDSPADPDNLHQVGTFSQIFNIVPMANGAIHITLIGLRRVELQSFKYDLVPDLDSQKIHQLAQSVVFGGPQPTPAQKKTRPDGTVDVIDIIDASKQAHTDRQKQSKDGQSQLDKDQQASQQLLQTVMATSISKFPQHNADPTLPPPPNTKRVLIGNINHYDEDSPYLRTHDENGVRKTPLEMMKSEEMYKTYTTEILAAMRELLQRSTPGVTEQLNFFQNVIDLSNPGHVADVMSSFTNATPEQLQQLLETFDLGKRLHLTLLLVKREVELSWVHNDIQKNVEEHLQKTQREFYLKMQLQQIKKELGMERGDDKQTLPVKFKTRIKDKWNYIPQYAKAVMEEELSKLETLETSSSEYNVTRNYLDWLTVLPWNHSTEEIYDIKRTETILNEEHYGMQDVKDRILEFVSVGKLLQRKKQLLDAQKNEKVNGFAKHINNVSNSTTHSVQDDEANENDNNKSTIIEPSPSESTSSTFTPDHVIPLKRDNSSKSKVSPFFNPSDRKDGASSEDKDKHQAATGKILLFVGPPGVGKTSIGKSIAKSLNREFYRFSVGGLTDVSEIKGHRRTYVGALPGKIVQALKKTQCSNPVILIDEIDKMGRGGNHGDPSSALLELLDPEQNSTFTDHYLDIPIDLSKVLFICTANNLETMSGPLRDRMDIVQLSGYIQQEKEHIAKHYLEPQLLTRCGLARSEAEIKLETISHLVRWYCREAGVRQLQKFMEMIFRKVSFRVVRGDPLPVKVTVENLSEYVGQETYQTDRLFDRTPIGVVAGLAWSRAGGSTMYIESAVSNALIDKKKYGIVDKKDQAVTAASPARVDDVQSDVFEIVGGNIVRPKPGVVSIESNKKSVVVHNRLTGLHPTSSHNTEVPPVVVTPVKTDDVPADDNGGEKKKKDDKDDDEKKDKEKEDERDYGTLKLTGSLGEVMKESASIAYTLSKIYLHKLFAEYKNTAPDNIVLFELQQQDAPIDPLNCKIPVLRPPISNTTSVASKFHDPSLYAKQDDKSRPIANKNISDMLSDTLHRLEDDAEDDLLGISTATVTPITQDETAYGFNPQRALRAGSEYVTPFTRALPKTVIPVQDPNFFAVKHIHIHAPQGATPKDGPSAGIALVSVLLSQALQRPLVNNIAMTGEVSLTGKVLAIGGLREKIIGARQSGIFHLIVPKANMHDIAEMPAFITSELTIYFADTVDEVIRLVFGAPYALNGESATPTLLKKYDKFDGDVEYELMKDEQENRAKEAEVVE